MIALALLGLAMTVLIKSAAGSIFNAESAHMLGISTDLARGKMYDIEEKLLKEGFSETDQSEGDPAGSCSKDFADEGWATIAWCDKVEPVEMPSWDNLQQLALGHAKNVGSGSAGAGSSQFGSGSGSALGSDAIGGFQNSALGGMLGMLGAFGGGGSGAGKKDVAGMQGGALIQSQYTMFQQILKVSVRKVTLNVKWKVLGSDRELKVVAFFTDPAAMDKVINGLGAVDLADDSGAGSGSSKTTTTTPAKPK